MSFSPHSLQAISELDPGQITGPLSSIFRNIIDLLSGDYDYDTTNLAAAPVRVSFCFSLYHQVNPRLV